MFTKRMQKKIPRSKSFISSLSRRAKEKEKADEDAAKAILFGRFFGQISSI